MCLNAPFLFLIIIVPNGTLGMSINPIFRVLFKSFQVPFKSVNYAKSCNCVSSWINANPWIRFIPVMVIMVLLWRIMFLLLKNNKELQPLMLWASYSSWRHQNMARLFYGREYLRGCTFVLRNIYIGWSCNTSISITSIRFSSIHNRRYWGEDI